MSSQRDGQSVGRSLVSRRRARSTGRSRDYLCSVLREQRLPFARSLRGWWRPVVDLPASTGCATDP